MVLLVWHRGPGFEFHICEKRNPEVGTVVIWVARSSQPANPTQHRCPSRTWVGSTRSQSNNDCVGFIYEYIPILWLFVGIPHQYLQSDHYMQSSCSQHSCVTSTWWQNQNGSDQEALCLPPGLQGQLRPGHKLNMEAERQWLISCVR